MNEYISKEAIRELFDRLEKTECGNSYLIFEGKEYRTDMAPAFEGMKIFLDLIMELPSVQFKSENGVDG